MIAATNDPGSKNGGGETDTNMMTECCDILENGEPQCETWNRLHFPTRSCDTLGLALSK